ncbi:MAG: GNAT family N-acetyltransferase [Gemmatimonadetes bacterium]|nr:GNAT family N-acetyltransferase [Gemmatimonadota bacterium]
MSRVSSARAAARRLPSMETARLTLQPYTPDQLLALRDGLGEFEESMGVRAGAGLRDFFVSDDVSPQWLDKLRRAAGPDPWVFGFAVIHREDQCVIGAASFKGPPDDRGVVEIAYGIVPAYQGQGYATEAASALVAFAVERVDVRMIRAHTMPDGNASMRVLVKSGFQLVGDVIDEEDGLVCRWERPVG